ncbi:hypothetical protein ATANTOWER_005306 [Ataeniobius toweri]|uniref:Uncharacterized protein n=1 Tax=Ataeniobius toweri TaxID=208326 RepID=A0ABU7BDX4_9TELE|nr:hypothetical protein [Ataeniobius toweri]
MPVTHPPVWHTSPHQAGWSAPPPKRSHISINTVHCPAKTTHRSLVPSQPTEWAPKPGTKIQGDQNDSELAEKSAPAPHNPQDPNPNPSPDHHQKARSLSRPPTPDGKQQEGPTVVVVCI